VISSAWDLPAIASTFAIVPTEAMYPDKSAPVFLSINFTSVFFGAMAFPV